MRKLLPQEAIEILLRGGARRGKMKIVERNLLVKDGRQVVEIPYKANILGIGYYNGTIHLWIMDESGIDIPYSLFVVENGEEVGENWKYIGTALSDSPRHIFIDEG